MTLADYIAADQIVVPLAGNSPRAVAVELPGRLEATGAVGDAARLYARLEEERPEDVVAVHERAFVIRLRGDAAAELRVALGTAPHPILRQMSEDAQPARIAALVLAPPRLAGRALQVVSALVRLLSRPDVVEELLAQPDAPAVAALSVFHTIELPQQVSVGDVMNDRPRVVAPDSPLRDAARTILRARIAALPVVDDAGRIVGMLGERELMHSLLQRHLHASPAPPATQVPATVREAMNRQVLCVSPDQPIADVVSTMVHRDVERVPVVRDGRLVGLLTRGDVVRKLLGP